MTEELNTPPQSEGVSNPHRRTVMKAAAWAAPVVAVAASAPLAAASLTNNHIQFNNSSTINPGPRPYNAGTTISGGLVGGALVIDNPSPAYNITQVVATYAQTDRLVYVYFQHDNGTGPKNVADGDVLVVAGRRWRANYVDLGEVELELLDVPLAIPTGNAVNIAIDAPTLTYATTLSSRPSSTRPAGGSGQIYLYSDDGRTLNGPFGTTTY